MVSSFSTVKRCRPLGSEASFGQQFTSRHSSATSSPSHSGRSFSSEQFRIFRLRSVPRDRIASGRTCSISQYSITRSSSFGLWRNNIHSLNETWQLLIHSLLRRDADTEVDDQEILPDDIISLLLDTDKSAIASGRQGLGLSFGHFVAVTVFRTGNMNNPE